MKKVVINQVMLLVAMLVYAYHTLEGEMQVSAYSLFLIVGAITFLSCLPGEERLEQVVSEWHKVLIGWLVGSFLLVVVVLEATLIY